MTSDLSRVTKMFLVLHNVILNIISPEAELGDQVTRAPTLNRATWAISHVIALMEC